MSDTQFKTLLSKYNVLLARCRDLEEQNNVNTRHWKAEEERFKQVEDLIRKLCETILAKDHKEMVLGESKSWYSTPVDELIIRAHKSYREYNQETTRILLAIQEEAEKRRMKIEGLEDQIQQYLSGNVALAPPDELTVEGRDTAAEPARDKTGLTSAAEAGRIELIIEESSDSDMDAEDLSPISELMEISEQSKLTSNAVPVRDSVKKAHALERERENAMMSHLIDLSDLEKRFNDVMVLVLSVIGEKGVAKYPEIEQLVMEADNRLVKNKVRIAVQEMYKMKVLDQEILKLPISPRFFVYKLTDIGVRLYRKRFGKTPAVSEIDRVRKEHDNLEHGYGIMAVEKVLAECGRYKEVHIFNRKRAIPISGDIKYIPDLICIPVKGHYSEYIEYERGTHTQTDFNVKCNKMCKVTRFLNFVAPNRTVVMKRLRPQIDKWIEERGAESLKNIHIRITTPSELRTADINDAWLIVYDLNKGAEPIKDGTRKETGTL